MTMVISSQLTMDGAPATSMHGDLAVTTFTSIMFIASLYQNSLLTFSLNHYRTLHSIASTMWWRLHHMFVLTCSVHLATGVCLEIIMADEWTLNLLCSAISMGSQKSTWWTQKFMSPTVEAENELVLILLKVSSLSVCLDCSCLQSHRPVVGSPSCSNGLDWSCCFNRRYIKLLWWWL